MIGPENVTRGVTAPMPIIESSRTRRRGIKVLSRHVELVEASGAGLDFRYRASELAVFGIIGSGQNLNGRNHVDRQVDRVCTGNRIGNVGAIHERPVLR